MNQTVSRGILGLCCLLITANAQAQRGFDYPELMVTPSASQRLQMELQKEPGNSTLSNFLPFTVSALLTFSAGVAHMDKAGRKDSEVEKLAAVAPFAAIGVGGGWIFTWILLSKSYRPYSSGWKEVKKLPQGSKRQRLTRERLAEEQLNAAARVGRTLAWISFLTNAGASFLVMDTVSEDNPGVSQILAIAGMAGSILPLLFRTRWQRTAAQHKEYKKKIYAPIAGTGILPDPSGQALAPGIALTWAFN